MLGCGPSSEVQWKTVLMMVESTPPYQYSFGLCAGEWYWLRLNNVQSIHFILGMVHTAPTHINDSRCDNQSIAFTVNLAHCSILGWKPGWSVHTAHTGLIMLQLLSLYATLCLLRMNKHCKTCCNSIRHKGAFIWWVTERLVCSLWLP